MAELVPTELNPKDEEQQAQVVDPVVVEEPPKTLQQVPEQQVDLAVPPEEAEAKTAEDLPKATVTETGQSVPRLTIAPVTGQAREMSQANMLESFLPPAFRSVTKLEAEDVAARKEAAATKPDFKSFIQNIQTSGTPGMLEVGGKKIPITSGIANSIKIDEETGQLTGDPKLLLNLQTMYKLSGQAPTTGVVTPYETAAGQFDIEAANKTEEQVPKLFRQYNARKQILPILEKAQVPQEVQQTIIENLDFSVKNGVLQRLAEAGRFVGKEAPDFLIMMRGFDPTTAFNTEMNPVLATIRESGALPGTAEFNAEYEIQSEKFRDKYLDFKGWMNDNIPAATLGRYYDEQIHRILEEQLPPEEYEKLAYERDVDGEIITAENGDKIKASFIPESVAYEMNDATFDAMHPAAQGFAIVAEESLYGFLGGAVRTAEGLKRVEDILELAKLPKYKHLLQGLDNPRDIQMVLERYESRAKADTFFQAGIEQYETNRTLKDIDDRLAQIQDTIDNMANRADSDIVKVPSLVGEGTVDLPKADHLRRLDAEAKQLKQTRRRAQVSGRVFPYIQDVGEASTAIGVVTALGREYGPFDDENANEAAFNLAASLGLYRPLVYGTRNLAAKGAVAGASRLSNTVAMPMTMIRDVISSIPITGPIMTDRTLENIEQFLGRKFNQEERRHYRTVIEFYKKLKPEDRASALTSQRETFELIERYASKFQNPERMRKLILDTYEHTSGIVSLIAAGQLNDGARTLDLKKLSKYDIDDMESNLKSQQNHVSLAEEALRELREGVSNIANPLDRAVIQGFVDSKVRGLEVVKNKVNADNRHRLRNLKNLENHIIKFGYNGADAGTLASLNKYRTTLTEATTGADELGVVLDKAENVKNMKRALQARVDIALKKAESLRGKPGYEAALDKAVEELVNTTRTDKYLIGDDIFNGVREIAKVTGPIDIKNVVMELADGRGAEGLKRFFGPDSDLWRSSEAVDAEDAFIRILNQSISATDIAELRSQLLKKAKTGPEAGKIQDKIKNMSDLDIALELMEKNPDFNPFVASDPFDLELLRRQFKRAEYDVTKRGGDAQPYRKFVRLLDETIASQDERLATAFGDARTAYEIRVGTPTTETMYIDNLIKNRARLLSNDIVLEDGSLTSIYNKGFNPTQIFDELGDGFANALAPLSTGNRVNLKDLTNKLVYSFGEYDPATKRFVFDESTEEGAARLEDVRNIIRAVVQTKMGPDFLKKYKRVKSRTVPEALVGEQSKELLNDIDMLVKDAVFPVKQADGTIVNEAIFDPMEILEVSKPLQQVIREQPLVRKAFEELKAKVDNFKQNQQEAIAAKKDADMSAIKMMENVLGITDHKSFFENFIISGEGGSLKNAKNAVVRIAEAEGRDPKEALKQFQDIAALYTIQGFFNMAGVQAKKGKLIRPEGAEPKLVAMEIAAPERALEALMDPDTRAAAKEVMGEETYMFFEDTLRIMNESTHIVRAATQTNDYKGIQTAGIVSRLWNGIKGFVSPIYIATEFLLTSAKAGQISIMKLAVQDKEAAIILHKMINQQMTKKDMDKFELIATNYIISELGVQGMEMSLTGEDMPIVSAAKEAGPEAVQKAKDLGKAALDTGQSILDSVMGE